MPNFSPSRILSNKHIQTIYASLFRKFPKLDYTIERFTLSDGDFLNAYWYNTNKQTAPLVILFHGLAGSFASPYIQGIVIALQKAGFRAVLMHFRSCDGEENLLARSYHSGETGDAKEFISSLKKRYPNNKLYAIGYSLGANMLLKLLGEEGKNTKLNKAIAISPPMDLAACANQMNKGFSRYYQYRLVNDLKFSLLKKHKKYNMQKIKTFWEFDEAYTAPVHGFDSAEDYYTKCSSKQFLKNISTPTLIIHSEDDPFMTQEVIPKQEELSQSTHLLLTKKGGHVGFIGGTLLKPQYWMEERVIEFLSS